MKQSEAWSTAFEALVRDERADAPSREADGAWSLRLECSLASAGRVLAALPGEWVRLHEAWEELVDQTGEGVDYETESGVWACDAERAVFHYVDHWQAGLCGTVSVYPTEDAYRAECLRVLLAIEEDGAPGAPRSEATRPNRVPGGGSDA